MKRQILTLLIVFGVMFAQETTQPDQSASETHEFRADVARLMDIIINSLYTHKEVFLRELISNASDALDKIKYNSLIQQDAPNPGTLEIKIELDKENKIFSIADTGIGMTKDHLIKYLGSVAKSGTTQFIEAITQSQGDMNLIGQFGVGFYSVFLVADRVDVISKHDEDNQYIWTSSAGGTFTVYQDPQGNTLGRGTKVRLHLKQDAEEFLEDENVEKIIEKYSMFINYPIYMWNSKTVDKEVDLTEEELAEQEAAQETTEPEQFPEGTPPEDMPQEEKPPKKKTKTVREEEWDWELINDQKPIWMRPKEEITKQEYNDFYKALTNDYQEPLSYEHFTAEGEIMFKALLFVPTQAPADIFQDYQTKKAGIKLYVRRVLISEEFDDLVPRYMSFLKGVIDSDDLPLNVARENLQQQKVIKLIGKKLARKAIQMIKDITEPEKVEENPEKPVEEMNEEEKETWEKELENKRKENQDKAKTNYETFWKQFGKNIKLGVIEDAPNRAKLAKLLRFFSTKEIDKLSSLDEYMERMKEDQKEIYYIAGTDINALDKSPLIQRAKKLGIEVLLLEDPIDEYTLTHLQEYEGLKLSNAAKSDTKFGESEAKKEVKLKEMYRPLTKYLKETLSSEIDKVQISSKLETIPFAVTTGEQGWTANMERIQRAQALGGQSRGWDHMKAKRTLEINPSHPIVKQMLKTVENKEEDKALEQQAKLLYYSALMQSGFVLNDPTSFSDMVQNLISTSMGVDNEPIEEPYIEPEPEEQQAEEDLTDSSQKDQETSYQEGQGKYVSGDSETQDLDKILEQQKQDL